MVEKCDHHFRRIASPEEASEYGVVDDYGGALDEEYESGLLEVFVSIDVTEAGIK